MEGRGRRVFALMIVIGILIALMSLPACSKSDAKKNTAGQEYDRHKMETKDPDASTESTEPTQRDTSARLSPTSSPTPPPTPNPTQQQIVQLTEQDIQDMNNGEAIIIHSDEGYVSTIVGRFFDRPVQDENDAIHALEGIQSLLGIETGYFPFSVYGSTFQGCTFYTYRQLKGDLLVQNASLKIVLDREGYPFMLQSSLSTNLDYEVSDPKITAADAEDIVLRTIGNGYEILKDYTMETCLVDDDRMAMHCFQVMTNNPQASLSFDMPYIIHFVDYDGNYIKNYPTAYLPEDRFADSGNETYFKDMEPEEHTFTIKRNGESFTFTVPVSYNRLDGRYYLADPERKIILADYYEFVYNGGNLLFDSSDDAETWKEIHLITYYNFIRAYDFFKAFHIESTDGFGMPILILTDWCNEKHEPGGSMCNMGILFGWSVMAVSDSIPSAYSMDAAGHEYTHGISNFSRQGCVYYDEYGTINEAFSEILGNISEMYMGETDDTTWLLAETCGKPVLCMSQPDLYYQPNWVGDQYYTPHSVMSLTTDYTDFGGVHRNDSLLTNLCCVLEQHGMTLTELANYFLCAIEMHTTLADFDDMYGVFIAAAKVCGREDIIPLIEQYWQDKNLIGNREKTNETTSIPSYEKALIPFSPDVASRAIVYAVAEDDTVLDWAPVQLDGIAVITVPEGTRYFIAVVEYRDYYFTDQVGTKYLDQNKTGWSDGSNGNYSVLTAGSGVILDLPEYA